MKKEGVVEDYEYKTDALQSIQTLFNGIASLKTKFDKICTEACQKDNAFDKETLNKHIEDFKEESKKYTDIKFDNLISGSKMKKIDIKKKENFYTALDKLFEELGKLVKDLGEMKNTLTKKMNYINLDATKSIRQIVPILINSNNNLLGIYNKLKTSLEKVNNSKSNESNDVVVSVEIKNAVDKKDLLALRIMLADDILVDVKNIGKEDFLYNRNLKYILKNISSSEFYKDTDDHDLIITDKSKWTKDHLNAIMVKLKGRSGNKKLWSHAIEVADYIYNKKNNK